MQSLDMRSQEEKLIVILVAVRYLPADCLRYGIAV